MADPTSEPELRRGATAASIGTLSIVGTFCLFQYWLLTATMEAFNAGTYGIVLPACAASIVCFLLAVGLVLTAERAGKSADTERDVN